MIAWSTTGSSALAHQIHDAVLGIGSVGPAVLLRERLRLRTAYAATFAPDVPISATERPVA